MTDDAAAIGALVDLELGAVGQLAHDVVEHVGGHGGGAVLGATSAGDRLDDLDIEIGGGEPAAVAFAACTSTLDRMGMVLRRSTTLCTWLSALRKADLSIVTRIFEHPVPSPSP